MTRPSDRPDKTASRPNVLWVMCDQLRGMALGCAGDPNARTPNLDRLAGSGVRFTTAVSQYPICTPFRGGLVTGRHAHLNGCRVHGDLLPPGQSTVATRMSDAGYRTAWVGKWHLASVQGVGGWKDGADYWVHPHLRGGFSTWAGFDASNHFYHTRYSTGTQIWPPKTLHGYQTDALTDLALTTLADLDAGDEPWFTCVSYEAPHPGTDADGVYRHVAPPDYEARHDPAAVTLRGNCPDTPENRLRAARYHAQIENLDHNVGRLLDAVPDDTVVLFFSDHGEMLGSHGLVEKTVTYDESILIPLLIRAPGLSPRVVDRPVSGLDIPATTLALAGLDVPGDMQGRDALAGEPRDAALVQWLGPALHGFADFRYRAVRTPTHTYTVSTDPAMCNLYDNAADPLQQRNLYAHRHDHPDHPAVHAALLAEIEASGEPAPDFILAAGR